jgi:NDP-sugar pyrophosphorylase family protein
MQIVIPMAGHGERFKRAGYTTIKPLIEVDGKPMIEYVARLFPGEENFVFLCNQDHLATTPLGAVLRKLKPSAEVVAVASHKKGPVWSIIDAATHIADDEPVIVNYCDFDMHWDYENFKRAVREKNADSAAVCYKGFHPHLLGPNLYAGTRVDENNWALEVREKHSFTENKMDTWQQAGTFYFRNGAMLKKYARLVYDSGVRTNGECYMSNLFNHMIADGLSSLVYPVEYFCQWGTPEDLAAYERGIVAARLATAGEKDMTAAYWHAFLDKRKATLT